MQIWILIRIQEFLMEYLLLWNIGSCRSFSSNPINNELGGSEDYELPWQMSALSIGLLVIEMWNF